MEKDNNNALSMVPENQKTEGWLPWNQPVFLNLPPIVRKDYGVVRTTLSSRDAIRDRIQALMDAMEDVTVSNIESGEKDPPLLCPQIADDLTRNLKAAEVDNRPRTDYMASVQKNIDVNPQERLFCVDWLVYVADSLSLGSDTLHLAVNCFDRYLSGNEVEPRTMLIAGLTSLIIAAKFQEVRDDFKFDAFVSLTQGCFSRQEILNMEKSVLVYLNYKLANPTAWSFLDRFVRAAKAGKWNPLDNLGNMASYLAELSLLSYTLLQFRPSLVAASCVFLALYYIWPLKRPWNATLRHYTLYKASDLRDCVEKLHALCYMLQIDNKTNVSNKYCHLNYGCVGSKIFPDDVPHQLFHD